MRETDVLFTGTNMCMDNLSKMIRELPPVWNSLATEWIECVLANRKLTFEAALDEVLKNRNMTLDDAGFAAAATHIGELVTSFIRCYTREEIMRYLMNSDIDVTIHGMNWDVVYEEEGRPVNVHIKKEIGYLETPGLYKRSKILLNVMPWFKDGYHDRVATGLMSGTAVFTTGSKYLHEIYESENDDTREIWFYDEDHPERIPEQLNEMLRHPEKLQRSAVLGREKTEQTVTWKRSAEEIIRIVDEINGKYSTDQY